MTNQQIERPSILWLLLEIRAIFELGATLISMPWLKDCPMGDGHPVLVIPGLGASDTSTAILRRFLKEKNYAVHGWELGHNKGYNRELLSKMYKRIEELYHRYGGRKLSLIGWSLGGVYARELAKIYPEFIRQVITMGSPIRGHLKAPTNADWVYKLLSGHSVEEVEPELLQSMAIPPPVPMTAIYSKSDGIVPWEVCIETEEKEGIENIEIGGSHFGLGHNPRVLWCIADRLAQEEGSWRPFKGS